MSTPRLAWHTERVYDWGMPRHAMARTPPANHVTEQPRRVPMPPTVHVVAVTHGGVTTVTVRSVRTHRALFCRTARDARGVERAMCAAEACCVARGYVLVMPGPGSVPRHATPRAVQAA